MRKPKDLNLQKDFHVFVDDFNKVTVRNFNAYQSLSITDSKKLSKWLLKASEYLKNKKIKRDNSGYLP